MQLLHYPPSPPYFRWTLCYNPCYNLCMTPPYDRQEIIVECERELQINWERTPTQIMEFHGEKIGLDVEQMRAEIKKLRVSR
jgi:hypothetical protein